MTRKSTIPLLLLCFLAITWILFGPFSGAFSPAASFRAPQIQNPNFALAWPASAGVVDQNGSPRLLSDFKGKVVLLFFGYTQCPDVCPTALYRASLVMQKLGDQSDKVQVLFMTLDPQRDTVELLNQYVPAFDPRFLGLRPNPEAVPKLAESFKVFYRINPGSLPSTYTLDHGVTTYAYDKTGNLRLAISHGASVEDMVTDIQTLLGQ
jgi:protein SCO1